jgi:hypothetical protein
MLAVVMYFLPNGKSSHNAVVTTLPMGVTTSGVSSMAFTFPTDFWGEYTLK